MPDLQSELYFGRGLRLTRSQRARLRTRFQKASSEQDFFIGAVREKILAADNSDFLSQSEDFYILGVQVADVLPKVTADDLWDMMHGVGADQMYNPRFVAFFLGFTGQEFAAISDPNAIAKIRVHLENEDQWIMAAG